MSTQNAIERNESAVETGRSIIRPCDLVLASLEIHHLHGGCAQLAVELRFAIVCPERLAAEARHVIESALTVGTTGKRKAVPSRLLAGLAGARLEEENVNQDRESAQRWWSEDQKEHVTAT